MSPPRIMVIAHGHPDFSLGGGEIAAHTHWTELRRRGLDSMLIARTGLSARHLGASFSIRSGDALELLFSAPPVDHFRHTQPQRRVIFDEFRALLERFQPTVVHFHHYAHMGLEMVRAVRRFAPQCMIVMTLHEFLAMCNAHGQMLKTNGVLCNRAAPLDCHACFPEITPQNFFLRELFVKSFLNLVDRFVCPSAFLRERYVDWGIPREKTLVLENGQPARTSAPEAAPPDGSLRTRFVVLGQLSRLKGSFVLLEAARLLPRHIRKLVRLEIHALAGLEDTVRHCGQYRPDDVYDIVASNGWVIQPSIWWENSPLVIQEAFAGGRPVICSNIGGMAEKVAHGVSGLHFRVGSAAALAARIEDAATKPGLWEKLCAGVPRPPTIESTVGTLLSLYAEGRPRAQGPGSHVHGPAVLESAGT
jgi:glycosyltransferase involved in cell wall biosynthesis